MKEHKTLLQRAPVFLMPLLVIALSASLAKLAWMVIAPVQNVSAAPVAATIKPIENQQAVNFGRVIADTHLFGEVPKAAPVRNRTAPPPPAPPPPVIPKEPPVQLSLHGLWAKKRAKGQTAKPSRATPANTTQDLIAKLNADLDSLFVLNLSKTATTVPQSRGKAFAIMALGGNEQKAYKEGQEIIYGVTVLEIFSDKVIVDNRGFIQEIFLPNENNDAAMVDRGPAAMPQPNRVANRQNSPQPRPTPTPSQRNENLGQQDLRKLRTDIINDVSILAQYSAPEPLLVDGQVKGFRLHLSNRLRLLYQIGFRPGDVITALNGVRLDDPDTIQQILYNFIGSEQLSVSVMRGQEEETFRYDFAG